MHTDKLTKASRHLSKLGSAISDARDGHSRLTAAGNSALLQKLGGALSPAEAHQAAVTEAVGDFISGVGGTLADIEAAQIISPVDVTSPKAARIRERLDRTRINKVLVNPRAARNGSDKLFRRSPV